MFLPWCCKCECVENLMDDNIKRACMGVGIIEYGYEAMSNDKKDYKVIRRDKNWKFLPFDYFMICDKILDYSNFEEGPITTYVINYLDIIHYEKWVMICYGEGCI